EGGARPLLGGPDVPAWAEGVDLAAQEETVGDLPLERRALGDDEGLLGRRSRAGIVGSFEVRLCQTQETDRLPAPVAAPARDETGLLEMGARRLELPAPEAVLTEGGQHRGEPPGVLPLANPPESLFEMIAGGAEIAHALLDVADARHRHCGFVAAPRLAGDLERLLGEIHRRLVATLHQMPRGHVPQVRKDGLAGTDPPAD